MYHTTETAQRADLVLPAAGWGEKEGTFINSERRIGLVKKVSRAPGQALSDFNIFKLIAQYWGCGEMFARWTSPEAVFQLLQEISRGQPCDITGIEDYGMIDCVRRRAVAAARRASPTTPRAPSAASSRTARYYHPNGKARFLFEEPRPMAEARRAAEYPFLLLTGRGTSSQWHTQTRTGKSDVLRKLYPADAYVEINPADAERARHSRRRISPHHLAPRRSAP